MKCIFIGVGKGNFSFLDIIILNYLLVNLLISVFFGWRKILRIKKRDKIFLNERRMENVCCEIFLNINCCVCLIFLRLNENICSCCVEESFCYFSLVLVLELLKK